MLSLTTKAQTVASTMNDSDWLALGISVLMANFALSGHFINPTSSHAPFQKIQSNSMAGKQLDYTIFLQNPLGLHSVLTAYLNPYISFQSYLFS